MIGHHFLIGEGCIYLYKDNAVEKTDFVINSLMAQQFGGMKTNLEFMNSQPPKNLLSALTKTCDYGSDEQPVGFLTAIGYRNLIDVNKLVGSQEVQGGIESGKRLTITDNVIF